MNRNNVAIYCRLSKEDGNVESQSIQSQREELINFVKENKWDLYDIYIDDGFSGTNFNRPDFNRMINDIEDKKIDIVITKDLSRLGRNYIYTGYYTEEYFPKHKVRYIAINDNIDTFYEENNDFAPFKNIINEWYAKDISKKIRFTLDGKAKRGESKNTVFPLFGYCYNEKYERVPDPDTAPIVKYIFQEYLKTGSANKVAKKLQEKKIKLPMYYNAIKYNYNKEKVLGLSEFELTKWTSVGVRHILKNQGYLGTYITAQTKSKNYKIKKRYKNKDCYIFENRYPALVDNEVFNKVENMLKNSRSGEIPIEDNIYKGLIYCADCGRLMKFERKRNRKTGKFDFYRYYCNNKNCKNFNGIQIKWLNELLKKELKKYKPLFNDYKGQIVRKIERKLEVNNKIDFDIDGEMKKYIVKKNRVEDYISKIKRLENEKVLPENLYNSFLEQYEKEKIFLDKQLSYLSSYYIKDEGQKIDDRKTIDDIFSKLLEMVNVFDYKTVQGFINKIYLHSNRVGDRSKNGEYDIEIIYYKLDEIFIRDNLI